MLKKLMITTASLALLTSATFAQTPDQTQPAPPAVTAAKGQVITEQKPDQLLASKLKGTDVIGSNNEKIGDVNDMLFDKDGKILAYVVGVGGFLGIGSKDVALSSGVVPDHARERTREHEAQALNDQGRAEDRGRLQAVQGTDLNDGPGAVARPRADDAPEPTLGEDW